MLSEQAKAALERIRLLATGTQAHEIYKPGQPLDTLRNHNFANNVHQDMYVIAYEMLRLFPVKTLNGMVIRWDDEITPERLIASGFMDDDTGNYRHHKIMFSPRHGFYERVSETHTAADSDEYDYPLGECVQPTNMGEVWQLMAKCGCPVGGGK